MKKMTGKRIIAWIGIILLVLLYLATLITAFLHIPGWDRLFQACLIATIGVPILIWIYVWLYQKYTERKDGSSDH
ncbi:MAG: hypothetical protein ACI4SZ_03660 [Lachnospiraceae bacterium]